MPIGKPGPFTLSQAATLDASGGGQVELAMPSNDDYVVTNSVVSTSTNVKEPTARVYRDVVAAAAQRDGSDTGSNDSSPTRHVFAGGAGRLICVWAGGDVGARATFTITGTAYPAGTAPSE